jgi:glycosyltransferase involved in cell wall biosynthesis
VPALSTKIIPNGVDLEVFMPASKEQARRKMGLLPDLGVILIQGDRRDGGGSSKRAPGVLHEIIKGLEEAREMSSPSILILGGKSRREYSFGRLKIKEVPFLENPADVAFCYQAADLYVHPSTADTFPLAILEAMACGTPVVATAVGGVPEQVIDGETGYLVKPGDWAAMIDRAVPIMNKSDVREAMIKKGHKRIKEHFDLKLLVEAHLKYYEEILQHRRSAPIS